MIRIRLTAHDRLVDLQRALNEAAIAHCAERGIAAPSMDEALRPGALASLPHMLVRAIATLGELERERDEETHRFVEHLRAWRRNSVALALEIDRVATHQEHRRGV